MARYHVLEYRFELERDSDGKFTRALLVNLRDPTDVEVLFEVGSGVKSKILSMEMNGKGEGDICFVVEDYDVGKASFMDENLVLPFKDPIADFTIQKFHCGGIGIHDIRDAGRVKIGRINLLEVPIFFSVVDLPKKDPAQPTEKGLRIEFNGSWEQSKDADCWYRKVPYSKNKKPKAQWS